MSFHLFCQQAAREVEQSLAMSIWMCTGVLKGAEGMQEGTVLTLPPSPHRGRFM